MAITGLTPGARATQGGSTTTGSDAFGGLKTEDFIKILIAELNSQNPLEPIENGKILDQVSQINSLSTTNKLNETLTNFGLAQNLSSASSLIGRFVVGAVGQKTISGMVEKAIVENGQIVLMVDGQRLPLSSVEQITSEEPET